jgi:ferredoxin
VVSVVGTVFGEPDANQLAVSVDADVCVSSGNCASVAPEVFDQDEDTGAVILLEAHPGEGSMRAVLDAENLCPARAIAVHRART